MALLNKMKGVSKKLIDKFGDDMTIEYLARGSYDANTGDTNVQVTQVHTKGIIEGFDSSLVVAGAVNMNDLKITTYVEPLPKVGDKIILENSILNIISIQDIITIQNGTLIYALQARR